MTDRDQQGGSINDQETQDMIEPTGTGEIIDRARGGNGQNTDVGDTSNGVLPDEPAVHNQEEATGSH